MRGLWGESLWNICDEISLNEFQGVFMNNVSVSNFSGFSTYSTKLGSRFSDFGSNSGSRESRVDQLSFIVS